LALPWRLDGELAAIEFSTALYVSAVLLFNIDQSAKKGAFPINSKARVAQNGTATE
jgi:hypothetical protein